jgi:HEAT repeat protein
MLERLERIDWYGLGHAYGDASDVPRMIRALTSPDKDVREGGLADLFGSVRHQGDVYDSTPVVVPFLIELLDEASVPAKAELAANVCYYAPDYGSWSPYFDAEPYTGSEYTQQTRRAFEEGLPVYLRLLGHPDGPVRGWAARLLTLCFDRRDTVAGALRERIPAEPDAEVRTVWVLQLGVLNRPADAEFLAEVATRDDEPVVRLAAALGWVLVQPDGLPDEAVRIIEEGAKPPANLLARLPQHEAVVDRALEALRTPKGADVRVLLQLAHGSTTEVRKDALQKLQALRPCPPEAVRGLVQALADPVVDVRHMAAFHLGDLAQSAIWEARLSGNHTILVDLERSLEEIAPLAVTGLADRLAEEEDDVVRGAICRALKDLALWAGPAVAALRAAAPDERDAREALTTIQQLRQPGAGEIYQLAVGHHEKVAWMAGRVLVRIGRDRPEEVVPRLIEGLGSWPAAVSVSAGLLGELGPAARAAVPALQKAVGHSNQEARNAAARAIVAIDPTLAAPPGPDEAAIRTRLGAGASDQLVGLVRNLLNDANTNGQLDALWKIRQMGGDAKPAIGYVREAMRKAWLRPDAAGALGRLDPEAVRPMIPDLLRPFERARLDGDFGDRTILFLAYLGPELHPDAVRFLLGCLPEPGGKPRPSAVMIPHAVQYLREAEPAVLLPLVIRLLETRWEDEGGPLQGGATSVLKFLKKLGAPFAGATPAVVAKLQNETLAPLALETLSRIGSWSAVLPHLRPFLTTIAKARGPAEECVRRLGKAATAADVPELRAALDHDAAVVRESAAAALERLL